MTVDLDRIDRRILRLLQRDGRLSNAELAKQSNLSPATCHRRTAFIDHPVHKRHLVRLWLRDAGWRGYDG